MILANVLENWLPRGATITADIYCQQLRLLEDEIQEKRPTTLREVILLHDNARPHSDNLTKTLYRSWLGSHSTPTLFS